MAIIQFKINQKITEYIIVEATDETRRGAFKSRRASHQIYTHDWRVVVEFCTYFYTLYASIENITYANGMWRV